MEWTRREQREQAGPRGASSLTRACRAGRDCTCRRSSASSARCSCSSLVIGVHNSDFVRSENLFNLIASNSFFGMIALAAVFLLALGEIDLSVGWNFNLSAVIAALMMTHGWNPWIGAIVGILFGGMLGLVNGLLATGLRLPVIIVTLGTYSAYHGLSLVLSGSAAVVPPDDTRQLLPVLSELRRQGADARDHLRRARDRAADRVAAIALRLPRPGHRQQPRGRAARRHPRRTHAHPRAGARRARLRARRRALGRASSAPSTPTRAATSCSPSSRP